MKTKIIKFEFDKGKLQDKIHEFECTTGRIAYLFMNKYTAEFIAMCIQEGNVFSSPTEFGRLSIFEGNKCYVDNDLDFGEVDVR